MSKKLVYNILKKYYIMNEKIEFNDNKTYCFVETFNEDETNHQIYTDISIFEKEEWMNLLKISEKFEKNVSFSLSENNHYENLTDEQKNAIYFLYYCDYCKYEGFHSLRYLTGNKEVYNQIIQEKMRNQNNEEISKNQFRKWIVNHYDKINYYYQLLPF